MTLRLKTKRISLLVLMLITSTILEAKGYNEGLFFGSSMEPLPYVNGAVEGRVLEAGTNEPLIGANVLLKGTLKGTATDIEGKFKINDIEDGTHILVVSYLGFQSKEVEIEVVNGEAIKIEISLDWLGVEGEEITITAQARGQVAAINQQIQSNTISNIVSKDRIQELPDVNAAESIGRLPGVSIQRSNGEANKVVVRGLSPKYNTVTINGMRVPSTDVNDRSVDLSLISSGMLDGIEVTKALTPDKDADALGGSIDLKLRNAPEGGWAGSADVLGGYTRLQDSYSNYKVTGSVSNRFLEDKFGIILNFNTDNYDRSADLLNASYGEVPGLGPDDEKLIYPTSLNLTENDLIRTRLGGSVILDYRFPKGKIVYNGIYNSLRNDGFNRINSMNYVGDTQTYTLTEGYNDTEIFAHGMNLEQDFGWLSYDLGVSLTSSVSESPEDYSWEFFQEDASIQVASSDLDTLQVTELQNLFNNNLDQTFFFRLNETSRKTEENEFSTQANIKVPVDLGSKISGYFKTGFKYRLLTRSNDQNTLTTGNSPYYGGGQEFREAVAEQLTEFGLDPNNRIPMEPFLSDYTRNNFIRGDYDLGFTPDPTLMKLLNTVAIENGFTSWSRQGSHGNDYEGEESFTSFYAMTELEIGKYFMIMPGFRYEIEHTDYSAKFSTALEPAQGIPLSAVSFVDTTTVRQDQFFLPMVHAQIKPTDWINLRVAYTKSISRPDFRQFAPITYFNEISQFANAPNKDLKTSVSTNLDASLSIYRNKLGFFTASVFRKEIENLVSSIQFRKVPGQTILPDLEIIQAGSNAITVYTFINNPTPATVEGIELDWQTSFWYLPSVFKGLVLNVNYTHLKSRVEIPAFRVERVPNGNPRPPFFDNVLVDTVTVSQLPDQPNDILNLTLGYDFKGFSTRFSLFYQVGSVIGRGSRTFLDFDDTFVDDFLRLDITMKQKLPQNIEVYANFNNINNEGDLRYQSPRFQYPTNEQLYGFTMDVGFRYKF